MRYLLVALLLLANSFQAQAEPARHWSTQIESRETILQDGIPKWYFSGLVPFNAARDRLFLASTKNEEFRSVLLQNEKIVIPTAIFQRFLRLWKESPQKSKIENAFVSWNSKADFTEITVKRGLQRNAINSESYLKADRLWLGCYDSAELCLGFNDALANPNLLAHTVDQSEIATLSKAEIQSFATRTANLTTKELESIFIQSLVPQELASLYALKLMSRRASMLGEKNSYLKSLNTLNIGEFIREGVLYRSPPGVEVDFSYEHLEAKLREFINTQYKNVEDMARYLLAHFPYMAYEYDKGLGGYSVGPGFMFRIKRKVIKNPHSDSPENLFRINDSVEIMLTFNVGVHRSVGPASGTVGFAPGYVTKYLFSSFAPSREAATKSPWALTKEVVMGTTLDQLKPHQSFTKESGWMIGGVASGNIRVMGQNRIRPQGNMGGSYRTLSRHYVYIENKDTALVGFGSAHGTDFSAQAFIKVVARLAKIPLFTWASSSLEQKGGVYRVPLKNLVERGYIESEEEYHKRFSPLEYTATYKNKYMHFNVWFYRTTQTYWNGFIDFNPDAEVNLGEGMPDRDRRFYLLESSKDSSQRISAGHDPKDQNCGGWAAFEADRNKAKTHFFDGSFKLSCIQNYNAKRPLTVYQLESVAGMLGMKVSGDHSLIIPKGSESKQLELSWDIKISWKDLAPLFESKPTGWLKELSDEIEALQRSRGDTTVNHIEAQEKFAFVMILNHILTRDTEEARAKAFFEWIVDSSSKETFVKMILPRLKNSSVTLHVFRALAKDHSMIEQTYTYGPTPDTASFKLVEEKHKWIGSN